MSTFRRFFAPILAVLLIVVLPLVAATSFKTGFNFGDPSYHPSYTETVPNLIPAVAENLWSMDVWLEEITLTNVTDVAQTVTISDRQSTPRSVLSQVQVDARTTYVIRFAARYCPGGVSWVAPDASSIVGYIRGKR
jgi:hypothetical protein